MKRSISRANNGDVLRAESVQSASDGVALHRVLRCEDADLNDGD